MMSLQEFIREISPKVAKGSLEFNPFICEYVFSPFFFALGEVLTLKGCRMEVLPDEKEPEKAVLQGRCNVLKLGGTQEPFDAEITCMAREDGKLSFAARFESGFCGTLQEFFGGVSPTLVYREDGSVNGEGIVGAFGISLPVITFDSADETKEFPLRLRANASVPKNGKGWGIYGFLLSGIRTMDGYLNREGRFQLEVPVEAVFTGLFDCLGVSLILCNGIARSSFRFPVVSEVSLKIALSLPDNSQMDFSVPLFTGSSRWNLQIAFPNGFGISNIVQFFHTVWGQEGGLSALSLPENTLLDAFRLYTAGIFVSWNRTDNSLSMEYLTLQFALAKPWSLPVPFVTLERLGVLFQVTFGRRKECGSLLTAQAGGTLSVMLGKYKLSLSLEMFLPRMDFTAQAKLEKAPDTPGISDLAAAVGLALPGELQGKNNLLGEITLWGNGTDRSFAIKAGVYDALSFTLGKLPISLTSLEAGATAGTSRFTFYVQGVMSFGQGADAFSLYLKAAYKNPGWNFSGGLSEGAVNVGSVLNQIFGITVIPEDIVKLELTRLAVSYATEKKIFYLDAEVKTDWNIQVEKLKLVLSGRIRVISEEGGTDVSALAYASLEESGKPAESLFKLLLQVDHIQNQAKRSFLFRIQFKEAYLKAAWFHRGEDEVVSVNLGGMTLGSLVEFLVQLANRNKHYSLSSPWNLLNKIELSRFLLEYNITKKLVTFVYRADLDIAGLMYLKSVELRYGPGKGGNKQVVFRLKGKLLGVEYTDDNPIEWDAVDGQPQIPAENEKKFTLSYLGLGQHVKNEGIAQADGIADAIRALKEQFTPDKSLKDIRYDAGSNWLFGADFTVNDMVNVKVVLNDPLLYGLLVTVSAKEGSALESFNGLGLELMCKRVSSDVYMFRGELVIPKKYRTLQLGVVSLTLGTIRMEVYTNGGFYVDLGFPHGLDFTNSFSLQWGIYTGRGGIYFGITRDIERPKLPQTTNGSFSPIVELGLGLSVGVGRSFDFGIVKGGFSAEIFGVFEGLLAIYHDNATKEESTYYYVSATAGISGKLYLSVDFKIITIQASAEIRASAQLVIQAYRAATVTLELALSLSASIRILFIKIEFSFSFHATATFVMGKDQTAPWESNAASLVAQRHSSLPPLSSLAAVRLSDSKTAIALKLVPMFYIHDPSLTETEQRHGAAFLFLMEEETQKQWAGLLAGWALAGFTGEEIPAESIAALNTGYADSITYAELEKFLRQNVSVSYRIHWVEEEAECRMAGDGELEGYVFPMLPPLQLSFGCKEEERTVSYWKDVPVNEGYFEEITEYFKKLNPDSSYRAKSGSFGQEEGEMPIAKVFFLDYFQMYLREIIGRLLSLYRCLETDRDAVEAAHRYKVPVSEVLWQNPDLVFAKGTTLRFDSLSYTIRENDTIATIGNRFSSDLSGLWKSVEEETFLLRTGGSFHYGEGSFANKGSNFKLKEAAAFLFVRFFEEAAPEDMYLAGDIVRGNADRGIAIDWEEKTPGGMELTLPDYGNYVTLRGDTPRRLASFLRLLGAKEDSFSGYGKWALFYQDILDRNGGKPEEVHSPVLFCVEQVTVKRDLTLSGLAARICPETSPDDLPDTSILKAAILKTNAPISVPSAVYEIAEDDMTVAQALAAVPCQVEELGAAVKEHSLLPKSNLKLEGARSIPKAELLERVQENAGEIGAMLSRFLLQGLRVPSPDDAGLQPIYEVLQQMFVLREGADALLTAEVAEAGCEWVEAGKKQSTMTWEEIRKRLPSGDFSNRPGPFAQEEDFERVPSYFSVSDGTLCYRPQDSRVLFSFSEGLSGMLKLGGTAPKVMEEGGACPAVSWGSLLPVEISSCKEEGMFAVYGVDAVKRLTLHELLSCPDLTLHLMYKTSAVDKGSQNFWELEWSAEESFLAKTNLSVETRMDFRREAALEKEEMAYIFGLGEPERLLRAIWECSTVGGGGYYLQLKTKEGQTFPEDIFEENGRGTLWLLLESESYETLKGCANCCLCESFMAGHTLTFLTQEESQMVWQPRFPSGCIGLYSSVRMPKEEEENGGNMQELFQITGYYLPEGQSDYVRSNSSAPVMPVQEDTLWVYRPVVPLYRFAVQDGGEENPYAAVGKKGVLRLELRDILGNALEAGDTEILPYYNDLLIGIGQWPGTKISYALTGSLGAPVIRLSFIPVIQKKEGEEGDESAAQYQKKAAQQLACADVEVFLASPVNGQTFQFSRMKENDTTYLDLLRAYGSRLAERMGQDAPEEMDAWSLDFPLDLDKYPLTKGIFALNAVLTVRRSEKLAQKECARKADTTIWPSYAGGEEDDGQTAGDVISFCREARRVIPRLLLAQRAQGDTVLYGMTCGEGGFIRKLEVSLYSWTGTKESKSVPSPEYYALRPLYNGFISRMAKVYSIKNDYRKDESMKEVNMSDSDMELWAKAFLADMEVLLSSEMVQKAGTACAEELNRLIEAKKSIAKAVPKQLMPLREGAADADDRLLAAVEDRLKRSLSDGYACDIAAVCRLDFAAEENCRLTVVLDSSMENARMEAGKAQLPEKGKEGQIYLFFSNRFLGSSIPFSTDLVFPELEYDIQKDGDYESSKWLRFVEPLSLRGSKGDRDYLSSPVGLPNPVKSCPQTPKAKGHSCGFSVEQSAGGDKNIGWDYRFRWNYAYREQDTFYIRVDFQEMEGSTAYEEGQDLFDVLAEYSLVRDTLWEGMNAAGTFQNAYRSFTDLAVRISRVWGDWIAALTERQAGWDDIDFNSGDILEYSCEVQGKQEETGFDFAVSGTEEGQRFLRETGCPPPTVEAEAESDDSGELELLFTLKELPLFQCAFAQPFVRVVRNQNLLTDGETVFPVREAFIYRTQEVSLAWLPVSGEYGGELVAAKLHVSEITQKVMKQAVEGLFSYLRLTDEGRIAISLSASYYYGLSRGKENPQVTLPVTLVPYCDVTDENGKSSTLCESLGANLYQWFLEKKSVMNESGFLFDVKLYQRSTRKQILHFSKVKVMLAEASE